MPQVSPADVLANVARLKGSQSSANMDNYSDIFGGQQAPGTSPSMFQQASDGALADSVETTLGAGPSIRGLRRSADERRLQDRTNIQADDANFNEFALDRGMAEANVESRVGDVRSESKARRSFLPFAAAQNERDFGQAATQSDIRYGQPARIGAQSRVDAAGVTAQGRLGVEQERQSTLPTAALFKALQEIIAAKNGELPSPEEVEALKNMYGGIQ
jgi:hypothetical protein